MEGGGGDGGGEGGGGGDGGGVSGGGGGDGEMTLPPEAEPPAGWVILKLPTMASK